MLGGALDKPDRPFNAFVGNDAAEHLIRQHGATLFVVGRSGFIDGVVEEDCTSDRQRVVEPALDFGEQLEQGLRVAPTVIAALGAAVEFADPL
jgi:hypothetical protein